MTVKLRILLAAAALLAAPMAVAGAHDDLTESARAALQSDPAIAALDLDVDYDGEAIVLEGTVADYSLADRAVVEIARLPGVSTIVSNIRTS